MLSVMPTQMIYISSLFSKNELLLMSLVLIYTHPADFELDVTKILMDQHDGFNSYSSNTSASNIPKYNITITTIL